MSANTPTDVRFSFSGLARRGGLTGPHSDGWGIAFYEGRGCRVFHDPSPSASSPLAQLLCSMPIRSQIAIAHVRRANRGRVCVANTHPFVRELWGRHWTFAHNGQLNGIKKLPTRDHRPVGATDSEHAFCVILDRLRARPDAAQSSRAAGEIIGDAFAALRDMGTFNALLSDGKTLYASCSKNLCCLTRRAPFGAARLVDDDVQVDFSRETSPRDVVTVVATRALTDNEVWQALPPDSTSIFRGGDIRRLRAHPSSSKPSASLTPARGAQPATEITQRP